MVGPDFAAAFEASPDPCMIVDRELRCVAVNAAYCRMAGRARAELVGAPLADLLLRGPDLGNERGLRAFERVLETGRPEIMPHRPQGGSDHDDWTATHLPLSDADGRVAFVVQHLARASLPRPLFFAWMHELRRPLTVISGYMQLLRLGTLAPDMHERAFSAIERSVQQQLDLFTDLYTVSDIIAGKLSLHFQPTEIAGVVGAAVQAARPAAEELGVPIDVTIAATSAVRGDRERLTRVVRDLVQYALQLAKPGGRVVLRAEERGGELELSVTETSPITPEHLRQVLDRFETGRTREAGVSGTMELTLYIVEAHGGTAAAARNAEGGTTFTVRLPLWQAG